MDCLARLYSSQRGADRLRRLREVTSDGDRRNLVVQLALVERAQKRNNEAEHLLTDLLNADPSYRPAFAELLRMYFENRQVGRIQALLQRWMQFNPYDNRIKSLLEEVQRGIALPDSVEQNDS